MTVFYRRPGRLCWLVWTLVLLGQSVSAFVAPTECPLLGSSSIRSVPKKNPGSWRRTMTAARSLQPTPLTASSSSVWKLSTTTSLFMWSNDGDLQGTDRIKACVPYFLPLLDGDHFGHYIYQRISPLGLVNSVTIGPLADFYHSIPFLGIGLFVALTLGTRFNTDMDRTVRFNAQQAALIDVALIFPELISSAFVDDPLPRYIVEPCANFVWYAYVAAIGYSIYSNLRGRKPDQIPFISPYADLMVGPF